MGKKRKKKHDKESQTAVPVVQPAVDASPQDSTFKPDGKPSRKAYEIALFDLHDAPALLNPSLAPHRALVAVGNLCLGESGITTARFDSS